MTFLHLNLALAAAAAVSIPILIHLLFRRRRKPVMWGAMRFLLEAFRKQRRRLKLEQFLLLVTRCLLLACAGAAIARPILERAGLLGAGSGRTLYLLLDNSLASSAREGPSGETALDRHKREAAALLGALGPDDRAALLTLASPAEALVVPPSSDLGAIRALVEGLKPFDSASDWAGALSRIGESARAGAADSSGFTGETLVAALSDFTLGAADTGQALPRVPGASSAGVRVLAERPAKAPPGNTQILGVEPSRSIALTGADSSGGGAGDAGGGETQIVRVALRRTGAAAEEAGTTTVRLSVVGQGQDAKALTAARATTRWTTGQTEAVATLSLDPAALAMAAGAAGGNGTESSGPGFAAILAEIDQDAIPGDSVFRRPIALRETLRVGVIDRRRFGAAARADKMTSAEWVRLALRPSNASPVEVTEIAPSSVDAPSLAPLDAVFIPRPDLLEDDAWQRLRRFADAGGLVIVCPPTESASHVWTDSFVRAMGLGWRIAREPRTFNPPSTLAQEQPDSRMLSLVREEMTDLAKPVSVFRSLPLEETPASVRTLLKLHSGEGWIVAAAPGSGESSGERPGAGPGASADASGSGGARSETGLVVYLSSAPELSWTDLPAKPLMVPLMQELARQGAGEAAIGWAQTAGAQVRAPRRAVSLVETGSGQERASLVVDASGRATAPVRSAGLFRALDDRGMDRGLVALNADAGAGRTDPQSESVVSDWLSRAFRGGAEGADTEGADAGSGVTWLDEQNPAAALARQRSESSLSLPLLLAALALALVETALARLFSHASIAPARSDAGGPAPSAVGGSVAA